MTVASSDLAEIPGLIRCETTNRDMGFALAADMTRSVYSHEEIYGRFCIFLIDTGARLGEGIGLHWQDIQGDRVTFWLTKNGRSRSVPLTERAALALQDLCEGPLRGMFDGPTTPGLDLDARLVVLDLHAVRDSPAVGILMACATAWISALLARTADRPGRDRLINVADESWKIVQHTGLGEWFQANFKLARQFGVMNLVVLHKLADLQGIFQKFGSASGTADSQTQVQVDERTNSIIVQDIPENVKNGLEIVPVKWIDQVLKIALERMPTPLADDEPAAGVVPAPVAVEGVAPATTTTTAIKH